MICGGFVAAHTVADERSYHWAYATHFGTGHYELDGVTDTTVLSISPAWAWRKPLLDETGQRTIGYRFLFPVSVASTDFASLDQLNNVSLAGVDAFSVVPGVEVEIPLTERWSVKPQAHLGLGFETGGGETARIFSLSLRSQFAFQLGGTRISLVNGLERIGFSSNTDISDSLNMIQSGLDFGRVLRNTQIGRKRVVLNWHLMYTRYLDTLGLDLGEASFRPQPVDSEWEVGVAFGRESDVLALWRLRFDRVGLAYRFESDGEFSGISIVFRSLFDR